MAIIIVFIATAIDPLRIAWGVITGFVAKEWWQVTVSALAGGAATSAIVSSLSFGPVTAGAFYARALIGALGIFAWAAGTKFIRLKLAGRSNSE